MALSNRINMRGGGKAPTSMIIFEEGVFNVPMSANQFTRSGFTVAPCSLDSGGNINVVTPSNSVCSVLGTSQKVDLTNISTIVFEVKSTQVYSAQGITMFVTQNASLYTGATAIVPHTQSDFALYTIDVSNLSGEYYIGIASESTVRSGLCSKIYMV